MNNNNKENKKKLVKYLIQHSPNNIDYNECSKYLGCSLAYFNNKMHRGSFSFEDILIIAFACGFHRITFENDPTDYMYLNILQFFDSMPDVFTRLEVKEDE